MTLPYTFFNKQFFTTVRLPVAKAELLQMLRNELKITGHDPCGSLENNGLRSVEPN